ncbi:MAG: hypothetical protein D6803_01590 [Anaerolineae bacterium]|nr:MAG: hypothetical protein D6803_01590 [Anaerolineae bacterium]
MQYTQAYVQAPWRRQLRSIGVLLTVVLVLVLLSSLFVSVNARAATLGRQIQRSRQQIEALEFEIAQLRSELAFQTSATNMRQRAEALGFRPVTSDELVYVLVPGYPGRQAVVLAPPAKTVVISRPVISPAFTQSWLDWLLAQMEAPVLPLAELP